MLWDIYRESCEEATYCEVGSRQEFPWGSAGKESEERNAMWETWVRYLGWEDPLEKGKATHSSILAWRIPWIL